MGRRLLQALKPEVDRIKSEDLKKVTKKILMKCPDYICECSTSSTNKYHPSWSNGKGGLIRHTKAVCAVTERILMQTPEYDDWNWDIPWIAAILHDMAKYTTDKQEHSFMDHPIRMMQLISQISPGDEIWTRIARVIECHMSRWTTDSKRNTIGRLPENYEEWIVAHADMIVAAKFIKIEFDKDNNIIYE